MTAIAARLCNATFVRYFVASGIALGADSISLLALVAIGTPAGPSAAAAYMVGIFVHWLIVSRAVFIGDVAELGPARRRQKLMFVLSAMAGLAVTTAIVGGGAALGFGLMLTKAFAVAVSFIVNWLIRRHLVFRPQTIAA